MNHLIKYKIELPIILFWIGVWGFVDTVVLHYFKKPVQKYIVYLFLIFLAISIANFEDRFEELAEMRYNNHRRRTLRTLRTLRSKNKDIQNFHPGYLV